MKHSVSRSVRRLMVGGVLLSLSSPLASVPERPLPVLGEAVLAQTAKQKTPARRTTARRTSRSTRATRSSTAARPAAAPARAPRWSATVGAPALATTLGGILSNSVRSGSWGVMVVSLTRGDTLFAHNGGTPMLPASTMKMFTAAVALEELGPEHTFTTRVLRDGSVNGGVLQGNLYLRGDGDPMAPRYNRGETPMERLARQVAASGIRRVTGDVVADAGAFENRLVPEGWQPYYLGAAYAARVSGLSINENLMWIVVRPVGSQASVTLEPASTTVPVINNVRVVGGSGGRVSAVRRSDGAIQVRGTIGRSAGPHRYSLVIDNPPLYTGGALRAALQGAGVTVDGAVREGATPSGADSVAAVASPPLWQLVTAMNRESINIFAELLFRGAGRAADANAPGSAHTALTALRGMLKEKAGTNPEEVFAADGSGLSVLDRVTPRAMVQMLDYAHEAPWGPTFHASLPVAGVSETLRGRMRGAPAQGNLHAKTGTTNTVASLGGYVTAKNGEVLAFAFIYNGGDRWNAKSTMDAMGSTLAEFTR